MYITTKDIKYLLPKSLQIQGMWKLRAQPLNQPQTAAAGGKPPQSN